MQRVNGAVQHYAWGDHEFIPRLLGAPVDGRPWAELWLGTHPSGPSMLDDRRPLVDVTGPLPYLLKVLAAREPLSLQTHPDARQATEGFRRGRFADPHPKPELLCALTPFHALCGIRPDDATVTLLLDLGIDGLAGSVADDGPAATFAGLVRGSIDPRPAIEACRRDATRPEAEWVRVLDDRYPGDPGVAATLLLNLVVLEPGQALRLDAGNVHAYLRGAGIELMGPSDNVVRAGLTVKPVDVDQLLDVADLTPLESPLLPDTGRYELPVAGIALQRLEPGDRHRSVMHELAIERSGAAWYLAPGDEYAPDTTAYVVTR